MYCSNKESANATWIFECRYFLCYLMDNSLYSRVRNKRTPTLINFLSFFQGLRPYSGLHRAYLSSISIRYKWGYAYSICQIFQRLRLFKGVRLFQTLEYFTDNNSDKISGHSIIFGNLNALFTIQFYLIQGCKNVTFLDQNFQRSRWLRFWYWFHMQGWAQLVFCGPKWFFCYQIFRHQHFFRSSWIESIYQLISPKKQRFQGIRLCKLWDR